MPHSAAVLREALHLIMSAKKVLTDLEGSLLLSLNGEHAVSLTVPTAIMQSIPGLDNIWWTQLPCAYPEAPSCTQLIVWGLSGAICPLASVPQRVSLHLISGSLFWWQGSFGHDENNERVYRRHDRKDEWELAENEEHGFVALTDFLCHNTFVPYFT